jgi:hypothetical protein
MALFKWRLGPLEEGNPHDAEVSLFSSLRVHLSPLPSIMVGLSDDTARHALVSYSADSSSLSTESIASLPSHSLASKVRSSLTTNFLESKDRKL